MMRCSAWKFLLCLLLVRSCSALSDPYQILRVKRNADNQDIRKSYRQLAKEWHPDKSDDPEAQEKFLAIKQAYELLSDPERRKAYDLHGITDDDSVKRAEYSFHFSNDPFDELITTFGSKLHFSEQDAAFFQKITVSYKQYELNLVPKSQKELQLIFIYADFCVPCIQALPLWRKIVDTLEPYKIAPSAIHRGRDTGLVRRLGINSVPAVVLLIDRTSFVYRDGVYSVQKMSEFIRNRLQQYHLITYVDDNNVDEFLAGWRDNRVRALVFQQKMQIRLRYLIAAFHFRERVAFGFVQLDTSSTISIQQKYNVPHDMTTVLLFNENSARPTASVTTIQDIPSDTLYQVVSTNQYLALPRLSSQEIMEEVCPCGWNRLSKHLCVVLVTESTTDHDPSRQVLRQMAEKSPHGADRVRFAYIYLTKQSEFIGTLTAGSPEDQLLRVVIIWRQDTSRVKYEWLADKWSPNENLNDTKEKLETKIAQLLKAAEALSYEAVVKELMDEHAQSIVFKVLNRLWFSAENFIDSLTKEHLFPVVSLVSSILFILAAGYFMNHMVRLEEERIKQRQYTRHTNGNNNNESSSASSSALNSQRELQLYELRAERYNGLVRLLKPGCRTIVLLVDSQSKLQLIPEYHKIIWPYRKNKTLMFAYMLVERGLGWYKELLELTLPEPRELNINPRNCVGTVLALNGHRKYFCMFHAKHTEARKQKKASKRSRSESRDPEAGAFIGFDSESSESDDEPVLLQGTLLDGLSNWLDRLFEGTTHRFSVNYWPDFPTK